MAYDVTEERLKVRGSEQITRDLKVNRDAYINGKLDTKNLEIEDDLNVGGEAIFADDVAVHGDLYVTGTTTTTSEAQVSSSGNYIVTRDNNNSPMGLGQYSGLAVNNYATGKIATITSDHEGTWRISDSATSTATTFTDISAYNGVYYSGLTQTTTTGPSGILTDVDADELASVVLNGSSYYHHSGSDWFGPITLVSNSLDTGAVVTDATLIATLDGLTKNDLVYYRSVVSKSIDASTNQPLLTRSETSGLVNSDILVWDASEEKAVDGGSKISDLVPKTTTVNGHALSSDISLTASDVGAATSTDITNAINTLDVADSPVVGKYVSSVSETDGKISVIREDFGNSMVSGVKGNAEADYRRGLVNLTPANLGAVNKAGDNISGSINRDSGGEWISGRDNAVVRQLRSNAEGSSWNPVIGVKTQAGNWTMGSVGGEKLQLSYDTDANYAVHNNEANVIEFPPAGSTGVLALTSQIPTANSQLTNDSGFITSAALPQNVVNVNTDIPEGADNLSTTATAHKITNYRNGFTIPYQMDNTNDGGMFRVRGTSENDTIVEIGTWDDSGDGETIQFNYYPTTSQVTPTHSVTVPKKSGTIALLSDLPTNADTVDGYHASEGAYGSTVAARDANGYLNAVIFHDSFPTENINSYSSPTVMFKGNGDGYLRNTSLADLKSALGVPYAQVNSDWNATSGVAQILNKPSFALDDSTGIKNFYVETDNQYAKCSVGRALSYISKRAPVVGTEDYWPVFISKVFGGFNASGDAVIYSPTVTGTLLIPGESTARNLRNSKLQLSRSLQSGQYVWTLYIDNVTVWSGSLPDSSKWSYDLYISGGADDTYYKRRFIVQATFDHFEDMNGINIDESPAPINLNTYVAVYNIDTTLPQDLDTSNTIVERKWGTMTLNGRITYANICYNLFSGDHNYFLPDDDSYLSKTIYNQYGYSRGTIKCYAKGFLYSGSNGNYFTDLSMPFNVASSTQIKMPVGASANATDGNPIYFNDFKTSMAQLLEVVITEYYS